METEASPNNSIEEVLELLRELRYLASDFQGSIDAFFADNEEWQGIKSRLVVFEARFASMEVRLSATDEIAWEAEQIEYMLKELREINGDLNGMRRTFLETVEQASQRVM
jgi:hypothetical protein